MMGRGRRRGRWLVGLGVIGMGVLAFLSTPAGPRDLAAAPRQPRLWRGAYHVHTTLSDGSGTAEAVAAAAAEAGLDFVILTDHGDATRPPAAPRVVAGVLLIDGVEISTEDGHYVALDMPQSPYPLAGDGRAVVEDVRRLGGFGILAHPDSPRESLAWRDDEADADGFEWINADTGWRRASPWPVIARIPGYPFNPAGTLSRLAHYSPALFATRDVPTRRPQLALAAVDAHARIGWRRDTDPLDGGWTLARLPSYHTSFGTMGLVVPWLDGAPSGEAARDALAVLHAIRHRIAYSAVFSMARTPWLSLELIEPVATAMPGPDAHGEATLTVQGNTPPDGSVRLLRNGVPYRDAAPGEWRLPLPASEPAAIYRAEMWLPARRGWPALPVAVSAARGHNLAIDAATASRQSGSNRREPGPGNERPEDANDVDVDVRGWHAEHDPASGVTIETGALTSAGDGARRSDALAVRPGHGVARSSPVDPLVSATLQLAGGSRVSQFAALVADLGPIPPDATGLVLHLEASAPTRLSIQVREPRPGEGLRWRHSLFLDETPRTVVLPLVEFRPIAPASGQAPTDCLHALMLVMDTVNARPGDTRQLTVHAARWASRASAPR